MIVTCPVCEGTGCVLNTFDRPLARWDLSRRRDTLLEELACPRSLSGREIYLDRPCLFCHGRGYRHAAQITTDGCLVVYD